MNHKVKVKVLSIGYEGRSIRGFLNVLRRNGVRRLLDVRQLPLSRRQGFSKNTLKSALQDAGITYEHVKIAGNPYRHNRSKTTACLRSYKKYLDNRPNIVMNMAEKMVVGRIAVLCYERKHSHCHRSVLLEAVQMRVRGLSVVMVE